MLNKTFELEKPYLKSSKFTTSINDYKLEKTIH